MAAETGLAMSWEEWACHDGVALAERVRRRQVSTAQVAAQAAAAVARLNPKLEAVIEVFDDVRHNPDADGPDKSGRLYGVPIFLKDLGSGLKGRMQDSGSAFTKGTRIPATDPTVENFLRAGLVPLGRSTTPEFGMTFDTTTDYRGEVKVTRSPWNLSRTPGGSSGGSAAAVAAGVVPLSMASDGGGSIRIPASFCGLVGLKASRGRVPQPLARNEYVARVSIEGVVSRSVRDTAAVFDYLTHVPNGGSFIKMGAPAGSYLDAVAREPGKLRIGLSTARWGRGTDTDPQVAARAHDVARLLESLGHAVEELNDDAICDWPTMWQTYMTGWISSRLLFTMMAADRGIDTNDLPNRLTPMSWRHYEAAQSYGALDLLRMMNGNNTVTRQFGALMERYDMLLTPTLAIRVPEANGPYSLLRDEALEPWVNRLADACRYTMPANETGLPGINIPAGFDSDGLPIGVQLYGNFAREALLLQLAAQIERARPEWFGSVPPVHVTKGD
ncbi:MAG TPA: amidase [Acetobacteraceae bacterium]|jgi:amidase|nr:amidase [Acetobacteraceae bacterium]